MHDKPDTSSTNEVDPVLDNRRRRWARTTLDVSFDADREVARTGLLRAVAKHGFVPDEELHDAWRILRTESATNDPIASEAFAAQEEERLTSKVRHFAATMFDLPLERRRSEFAALAAECADFALPTTQMRLLYPGLAADLSSTLGEDSALRNLASHVAKTFSMSASNRAASNADLIRRATQSADSTEEWMTAAQRLKTRFPKIAALDAHFVDRLATWKKISVALQMPLIVPTPRETARSDTNQNSNYWVWLVVVLSILSALGRAGIQSEPSRTPTYSNSDSFQFGSNPNGLIPILKSKSRAPANSNSIRSSDNNPPLPEAEFLKPNDDAINGILKGKTTEERERFLLGIEAFNKTIQQRKLGTPPTNGDLPSQPTEREPAPKNGKDELPPELKLIIDP